MPKERIQWLDAAKAFGIILVFYVHLVQCYKVFFYNSFEQQKFLENCIIQFFFFISGFIYKYKDDITKKEQIKILALSRLIPVLFFNFFSAGVEAVIGNINGTFDVKYFFLKILVVFIGIPAFNNPTWFLICLFLIEVLQIFIWKYFGDKAWKIAVVIVLSFTVGLILSTHFYNFMYIIRLMLVPYGFYLTGYLFKQAYDRINLDVSNIKFKLLMVPVSIAFFFIIYFTYDLNMPYKEGIIVMHASIYGNPFLFLITSFSGICMMLSISMIIPRFRFALYIGINSLTYFCVNGIEYHFIDHNLAGYTKDLIYGNEFYYIIPVVATLVIISLLATTPFVYLLNKYFPQLIGKPFVKGPIINRT
ncbi:MAG: acyltransferase family protein [Spirochaetes bacterium]|jgi:acyltransferase|nr:acyltransferase family protein [Spirochaetota bacterium]